MNQDTPELDNFSHARTLVIHPNVLNDNEGQSYKLDPLLRLEEAIGLSEAIELKIINSEVINLKSIKSGTFFGKGTVERLKEQISNQEMELIVIDTSLSPIQQRNLERQLKVKVIDRTGLILEIFGARASTSEGRLQVELAALLYQRSRLVRSWTHLERQRGGLGFIGGPGETQIESDRRQIDERILKIKKNLEKVVSMRELHRKSRRSIPYPIVSIVGYTNAGKSTLFNRLTSSNVIAEDILFATLDPTMRKLRLPSGREIILSDTVGFISNLPTQLIAAFRATLEEVCEADLLLHIHDISHLQEKEQSKDVIGILKSLELDSKIQNDTINVFNKIDLIDNNEISKKEEFKKQISISSLTGNGIDSLLNAIDNHLASKEFIYNISITVVDGEALSWLYDNGTILKKEIDGLHLNIKVSMSSKNHDKFQSKFHPDIH